MSALSIESGNRTVVIYSDGGEVWATLFTETQHGMPFAKSTGQHWSGDSVEAARQWADQQLGAV